MKYIITILLITFLSCCQTTTGPEISRTPHSGIARVIPQEQPDGSFVHKLPDNIAWVIVYAGTVKIFLERGQITNKGTKTTMYLEDDHTKIVGDDIVLRIYTNRIVSKGIDTKVRFEVKR